MKYTDKLGLPIWNKPETDVFDIEQFNEGMQAIDDIVVNILKQINDLAIGDIQIDLNGYVKEEALKEYAKRTDLSKFLTQADLLNYLDKTYLDRLATKNELSSYAKKNDLSNYALTSTLSDYALKNSLLNYATTTQLQATNNNITNLTDRITNLENSGGGGGDIDFSGNAEDVTYNNPNYSELTSVDLALNKILDKLYYVKPSITSFNMSPSTTQYEKGQTVSNLSFTWSYNKNITSQSLSNCNITLSDRKATCSTPITSNKSFTLTCSDGENTVSASKNITFFDKIYWGSKDRSSLTSEFILSLSDSKFATAKEGTYSMTIPTGEYGYIAIPSSFGDLSSVWIGGFEVTVLNRGEIDFTNASGYTSKYKIYRTSRGGLGYITMQIKSENQQDTSVKVTGVTLSTNTLSMKVGGTTTLTANIRPSNATNKNVTWSTSNSSIASVSNGVVTAKAKGQATITVKTADGNYTDSCLVTVSKDTTTTSVTGVTLNKDTLTMNKIGGTQTLSYTITPSNATNKNVTWSTSVPTVASVNNGLVTANANGTTVITIRTTDGGHTDTCTVTVNDPSYIEGGGDDKLYVPDIASYGISKDGTNSEATTNGLNRLFADINTSGKTNVQLPTGTYAINPDISLTPKSNLTLDLNNSKLKIDTNAKNGSTMIYLKEVENLTLKNGTIEGDRYDHDYSTYNENTTSHEFNVGLKIDQGSRNINIDNVKFTKITGYGLATFQGTQYCNVALDKTKMESGDYNDSGSKVADATKIRYPQAINITEHATRGYLQVGTLLKYQNYVFNSTRTVTVRMFNASGSLLSKVTSKMYRPIAVPSGAKTACLTFHQSDPKDYLEGDMYTLDVFHMKPPRDCNITNCTFDDNRCLGIAVCGGWNIKIEGNTFKNTSKPTSDKTSPNYQHGKPGYAIDIEDGWESTQDLTINDNTFTNNGYGDIVSLAGDNTVITNNEFTGRVAMYSRNTNYVVKNNTIANGIAMWETEKDYGFTVDHNTYTDTTIKAKCYKPYDDDYYTFTNETITDCQMQLDTSITLKNSTIDLDGTTGSRFTGSYDTCTISDFDGTDANSDYNTGIKLNNCNVSKCNFFPSKDTIMTNNTFNTFRVRLDNGSLVFTGNDVQSNPKNTAMPIVQLNGGTSATIKNNTLGSAVTVDLYTNPANIPVITD